jgi:hypothetical protein
MIVGGAALAAVTAEIASALAISKFVLSIDRIFLLSWWVRLMSSDTTPSTVFRLCE